MEIGKIIRSKREELKMTQQQLADQLYVTRQTISKWELGKSEPDALSKKSLEKILAVQLVQESSSKFSGLWGCFYLVLLFYHCAFYGLRYVDTGGSLGFVLL